MFFFFLYFADDHVNRYTAFTTVTRKSLEESVESYLGTPKNQYAANIIKKKGDTRYAEPDPSLRPFFQFLLNSTKRKKRNLMKSPDRRLVENFINYSINELRNPVRADSLDSVILMHTAGTGSPSYYTNESETKYMQVPVYTKISNPERIGGGYHQQGVSSSPAPDPMDQTPTPYPYTNWQETPLIFPYGDQKPPTTRPPFVSSGYYPQDYDVPSLVAGRPPTFVTPVEHQAPVFITPVQHPGPTFVTPISVTQTQLSDGNPPPTIVILEDIDPETELPQSDPIVEQDPAVAGGTGGGAGTGALAAAAAAAVLGAGAGIVGISGGAAAAVALGGLAGGAGGAGGAGAGGGAGVGAGGGLDDTGELQPAQVIQCRSGASKVCSELITTSSSSASSSSSSSLLDGLITFFSALNFIGPLSLIFWSVLFPPMSIILTSGLGVLSFMFPFLLPRMWFGRQLGHNISTNQFDPHFDNTNNHYHRPYY